MGGAGAHRALAALVAASLLSHAGFSDVSDLIGGYDAWTASGLPVAVGGSAPEMAVQVTPRAAEELISSGASVVDVREENEWSAGHAPDAMLVPMSQVEGRLDEFQKERPTLVVCRTGGRSNAIAQVLTSHGINAVNLAGGMRAWELAGLPVVTDSGERGRII